MPEMQKEIVLQKNGLRFFKMGLPHGRSFFAATRIRMEQTVWRWVVFMRIFSRRKRKRIAVLFLTVTILVALGTYLRFGRGISPAAKKVLPVGSVITDENVYAITLTLTGNETPAALDLFRAVCEGLEVKPCVFVSVEWLKAHTKDISSLQYAELGLFLPEGVCTGSKKKVASALASQNEAFLGYTGSFPRFVRTESGDVGDALSASLQSYGQTCVAGGYSLSGETPRGAIVDAGKLNGTTGYALAKFCAAKAKEEAGCVSLTNLLAKQI